jgi:hypothetical protein
LNGAIVDAREKLFEPALKEQIKTALNGATNGASHGASHDLSSRKYIKWDDPRVEKIPPGEEDIFAVAEQINAIQRAQFSMHRHCYGTSHTNMSKTTEVTFPEGGTHARTQGVVKGEPIVEDDFPAHLKQSMSSKAGRYPVAMRYSSEPGDPALDDRIPQPRGCRIKISISTMTFYLLVKALILRILSSIARLPWILQILRLAARLLIFASSMVTTGKSFINI